MYVADRRKEMKNNIRAEDQGSFKINFRGYFSFTNRREVGVGVEVEVGVEHKVSVFSVKGVFLSTVWGRGMGLKFLKNWYSLERFVSECRNEVKSKFPASVKAGPRFRVGHCFLCLQKTSKMIGFRFFVNLTVVDFRIYLYEWGVYCAVQLSRNMAIWVLFQRMCCAHSDRFCTAVIREFLHWEHSAMLQRMKWFFFRFVLLPIVAFLGSWPATWGTEGTRSQPASRSHRIWLKKGASTVLSVPLTHKINKIK